MGDHPPTAAAQDEPAPLRKRGPDDGGMPTAIHVEQDSRSPVKDNAPYNRMQFGHSFPRRPLSDASRRPAKDQDTNIYIRGLPPDCTAEDLVEMCSPFGHIVSTKAVVNQDSKQCKGYGFVDFETAEEANRALQALNGDGKHHAQIAKEVRLRTTEKDPTNLYIANLPPEFNENSIRELLTPFGMVISTRVLRNPDNSSRCVGFARMESKEACDLIINTYNGKVIVENGEPLVVKLADSGGRRPKHSTSSSGAQSLIEQGNTMGQWQPGQASTFQYASSSFDQNSVGYQPAPYSPFVPNGGVDYQPGTGAGQFAIGPCYYDPTTGGYAQVPPQQFPIGMPPAMYNQIYGQGGQPSLGQGGQPRPGTNPQVMYPGGVEYYGKEGYKTQLINPGYYQYPYQEMVAGQQFIPPQSYPYAQGGPDVSAPPLSRTLISQPPPPQAYIQQPYVLDGGIPGQGQMQYMAVDPSKIDTSGPPPPIPRTTGTVSASDKASTSPSNEEGLEDDLAKLQVDSGESAQKSF